MPSLCIESQLLEACEWERRCALANYLNFDSISYLHPADGPPEGIVSGYRLSVDPAAAKPITAPLDRDVETAVHQAAMLRLAANEVRAAGRDVCVASASLADGLEALRLDPNDIRAWSGPRVAWIDCPSAAWSGETIAFDLGVDDCRPLATCVEVHWRATIHGAVCAAGRGRFYLPEERRGLRLERVRCVVPDVGAPAALTMATWIEGAAERALERTCVVYPRGELTALTGAGITVADGVPEDWEELLAYGERLLVVGSSGAARYDPARAVLNVDGLLDAMRAPRVAALEQFQSLCSHPAVTPLESMRVLLGTRAAAWLVDTTLERGWLVYTTLPLLDRHPDDPLLQALLACVVAAMDRGDALRPPETAARDLAAWMVASS